MKKVTTLGLASVLLLSFVSTSYASIDKNLKYGQRDMEVTELQEFLIDKGLLKSTPSTFFGLLTLKAVKAYQASIGVSPTGFVGALTREKINKEIEAEISSSNDAEINETRNIATQNTNNTITKDQCKNIEGVQIKVPDGMFMNNDGVCFTPTVKQETSTHDVCKNIDGIQTKVPDGLFVGDDKYCFNPNSEVHNNSALQTNTQKEISYIDVSYVSGDVGGGLNAKYKIKNKSSNMIILSGFRMSLSVYPYKEGDYFADSNVGVSVVNSSSDGSAKLRNSPFDVKFNIPLTLLPFDEKEMNIGISNINLISCNSVELKLYEMSSFTENVRFNGFPVRQLLQKSSCN